MTTEAPPRPPAGALTQREAGQVENANQSSGQPVVFIHL
jgi:hypothetical protein